MISIQSKEQKENEKLTRVSDLCNIIEHAEICTMRVPEGDEKMGRKKTWRNIPNLRKNVILNI